MSRTYSRLVVEGHRRLRLEVEPPNGYSAGVRLRCGGFFAGFESAEALCENIGEEHQARVALYLSQQAGASGERGKGKVSVPVSDEAGPSEPNLNREGENSATSENARLVESTKYIVLVDSEDEEESASLQVQHDSEHCDSAPESVALPFQGDKANDKDVVRIVDVTGRVASDAANLFKPGIDLSRQVRRNSKPLGACQKDSAGDVNDFELRDGNWQPVSLLDLNYKNSTKSTEPAYLNGVRGNESLKMVKISYFDFWFEERSSEPEVWVYTDQYNLVRLGEPSKHYKSMFEKALSAGRRMVAATKEKAAGVTSSSTGSKKRRIRQLLLSDDSDESEGDGALSKKQKLDKQQPQPQLEKKPIRENSARDQNSRAQDNYTTDLDVYNDPICSLCDDGGNVTYCDGPCLRSFHGTVSRGEGSGCPSLSYTEEEMARLESKASKFLCKNCLHGQQQCFVCQELGSSTGKREGMMEVFCCKDPACGKFYHLKCLDLPNAESLKLCPAHRCAACRCSVAQGEKLVRCRCCPKAWHKDCIPKYVNFDETDDLNAPQRGWILGDAVIVYCRNHEYDYNLGMPKRWPVLFPKVEEHRQPAGLEYREKLKAAELKLKPNLEHASYFRGAVPKAIKSQAVMSREAKDARGHNSLHIAKNTGFGASARLNATKLPRVGRDPSLVVSHILKRKAPTKGEVKVAKAAKAALELAMRK